MDPNNQMWPMNFDAPDGQSDGQGNGVGQPQQQSQTTTTTFGPGSVFMGVNTPPANNVL